MWPLLQIFGWILVLIAVRTEYNLNQKANLKKQYLKSISSSFYHFLTTASVGSDCDFIDKMNDSFDFVLHYLLVFFKKYFKPYSCDYLKMYVCILVKNKVVIASEDLYVSAAITYHAFLTLLLQLCIHGKIVNENLAAAFSQHFKEFSDLLAVTDSLTGRI